MNEELWKPVSEFPDRFMISSHGRVWSIVSKRLLKQGKLKTGYLVISSKIGGRGGRCICKRVHRWVAEEFLDNPDNKPFVNHIDGDKTNNHVSNLEWSTPSANIQHAYDTGLIKAPKGQDRPVSKLTDEDVRRIRRVYKARCKEFGGEALARFYGVKRSTVNSIASGKTWKHVV